MAHLVKAGVHEQGRPDRPMPARKHVPSAAVDASPPLTRDAVRFASLAALIAECEWRRSAFCRPRRPTAPLRLTAQQERSSSPAGLHVVPPPSRRGESYGSSGGHSSNPAVADPCTGRLHPTPGSHQSTGRTHAPPPHLTSRLVALIPHPQISPVDWSRWCPARRNRPVHWSLFCPTGSF